MPLATAFDAEMAKDRVLVFGAVKIELPGYTLRLLDGSGVATFGGGTYTGFDATFGTLAAIGELSDGAGDQIPATSITILPPTNTAAATLAAPGMQGSIVTIHIGALNPVTGAVIADPYLLFIGEVDVPTITAGDSGRAVEYECVSISERLFAEDEGQRLVDGFHQSIWPGETGFFDVTGVEQTIYWGQQPPAGVAVVNSLGGSTGNAGSFDNLNFRQF